MAEKIFSYKLKGLAFDVRVYETSAGKFAADIKVVEGSADFNSLRFADDMLNPRGGCGFGHGHGHGRGHHGFGPGSTRHEGERVDWDGGQMLSRPGHGRHVEQKDTFLTAGETLTVNLKGIDSLDDIAYLGVNATHASGGGRCGAIRAVTEGTVVDDTPPAGGTDNFATVAGGVSRAMIYFAVNGNDDGLPGVSMPNDANGDGLYVVTISMRSAVTADPDTWFDAALAAIRASLPVSADAFVFGMALRGADGAFDGAGFDPALVSQGASFDTAFFALDGDTGNEAFPADNHGLSGPAASDASINFDDAWLLTA